MEPYRVLLADDHVLLRQAIKSCLNNLDWLEVIGEVGNAAELMDFLKASRPDLIVLDLSMPTIQGIEAAAEIRQLYPEVRILVCTVHKSLEYLRRAFLAGVHGYILKENALDDLVVAIENIRKGDFYVSSLMGDRILREEFGLATPRGRLTNREMEVMKLISRGKTSKEVAEDLSISVMTVFNHRVNIKKKLGITKNAELIRYAIENGYS